MAEVLSAQAPEENISARLLEVWRQADQLGWFSAPSRRIVIQVGQACRSTLALQTAHSLAAFLRDRISTCTIEVLDSAAAPEEWSGLARCDVRADDALCVTGVAATRGLLVPQLWFESFVLITVTAAHPDPAARLAAVLDAQADPLRHLKNQYPPHVLIYEAHRLAASDLVVVCGHARYSDPGSDAWWIVGRSDVGVEQTLATATGIDPTHLPTLRTLARHEAFSPVPRMAGSLPDLKGHLAPEWQMRWLAARSGADGLRRAVVHDVTMVRRNLGKVPHFVRRRLAARGKGRAA